jgi:hypothetical protein
MLLDIVMKPSSEIFRSAFMSYASRITHMMEAILKQEISRGAGHKTTTLLTCDHSSGLLEC